MTRQEHLQFCEKCLNRKFDVKQGLVCAITSKIADFEGSCNSYKLDSSVPEKKEEPVMVTGNDGLLEVDSRAVEKLKVHQDFYYALVGGLLAVLIGAVVWAAVTVATKYQIGYMAIGVGLLVGYAVQFFGAGIDKKFGFLGAGLALLGCMLGNLFSQVGFIANEQSLGYFETLSYLTPGLIVDIMAESFSPMDVLFYGIAIYEGYKFAFRRITDLEFVQLRNDDYQGYPPNYQYRLPLVVVSILAVGSFGFMVGRGVNGLKTYKYESGNRMSEGELKKSKEHGKWTYWYENGNVQATAFYSNGLPDSLWQWFDETGKLTKSGSYKRGLENGVWMEYYGNGLPMDSGSYLDSRPHGPWKYWYEDGTLSQIGTLEQGKKVGPWETYFPNGNLSSEGTMADDNPMGNWKYFYENGNLNSELKFLGGDKSLIMNYWDQQGKQVVVDGNGYLKTYDTSGQLLVEGLLKDGARINLWKSYYGNGKLKDEGVYENDTYRMNHAFDPNGEQTVKDGNGQYVSYYDDGVNKFESGSIVNGLREGTWSVFYQSDGTMFQEQNYVNNKYNGIQKLFFPSGNIYASGTMADGLRVGEWTWYYETGAVSSTAIFVNDKKEGKQLLYGETGDLLKEEYYKNGELVDGNSI